MLIALVLAAQAAVTIPEGQALTDAVRARELEFFAIAFDRCDPPAMRAMVTDDFEMYHDRDGVVARSAGEWIAGYTEWCTGRQRPDAWRSRRELIDSTFTVHPIPGHGAIEDGEHQFYERRGEGPERLVGRARFTQLWRLTPDGWRVARVFSYGHRAIGD
ncbi:MAG TPA: nuclear transport factor 2 family protein [Allosphingosinicella sp.]|nr:nuclear transport factor 2 family protein [Allosphingosinicella sp.]